MTQQRKIELDKREQDSIVNDAVEEFSKSQNAISSIQNQLNFTLMPTISSLQKAKIESEQDAIAKELLENKTLVKDLKILEEDLKNDAKIA